MWSQLGALHNPRWQLALFFLLVGLVLVFIKMNSYERRIQHLEDALRNYITYEDYMETFNNMWAASERGESVAPFASAAPTPDLSRPT